MNRSRKIQKGGAEVSEKPDATSPTSAPTPVSPASEGSPSVDKNMDDEVSTAGKFLGLDLNKQEEIVKKIYLDFEKYYGKGGYGGETVDGDDG